MPCNCPACLSPPLPPARSSAEKRLLEAKLAYKKGKPIMPDEQYDALKASLAGSSVFALPREGPACTLGQPGTPRGQKQAEAQPDWLKMAALAIPPPLLVRTGWLAGLCSCVSV